MLYIPFPFRLCIGCDQHKLPSHFYRKSGRCKACCAIAFSNYRVAHKTQIAQMERSFRSKNKALIAETKRKEQIEQPEFQRQRNKRWKSKHKEKVNTATRRRRALKKNLPATFTLGDWQKALEYWHGTCAYCGNPPSLFDINTVLHQDHYLAQSKGGGYTPDNIVPACQTCNLSKRDKSVEAWLMEKFSPRKTKIILSHIQAYFEGIRQAHYQPPHPPRRQG